MKISTKSWHYKFLYFWYTHPYSPMPKSLCSYFWSLVAHIVLMPFLIVAGVIISPILGIAWLSFVAGKRLASWLDGRIKKRSNVLVEYMKAKKRKVCPLIEYKE